MINNPAAKAVAAALSVAPFASVPLLALAPVTAKAAAVIVDGNFETNPNQTPTPWVIGVNSQWNEYITGGSPAEGVAYASNSSESSFDTSDHSEALSQAVGGFTPGQTYTLSGLYAALAGGSADLGPNSAVITVNDKVIWSVSNVPTKGWKDFSADFTADSTTETVRFYSTSSITNAFSVDKLAFTGPTTSPAPEPAAWATMLLGMGLAGATLRRRRALTLDHA